MTQCEAPHRNSGCLSDSAESKQGVRKAGLDLGWSGASGSQRLVTHLILHIGQQPSGCRLEKSIQGPRIYRMGSLHSSLVPVACSKTNPASLNVLLQPLSSQHCSSQKGPFEFPESSIPFFSGNLCLCHALCLEGPSPALPSWRNFDISPCRD